VVRTHAVCVLGERRLGEAVGHQVLPLLRSIARSDPDDQVRGLAGLSLQRWRQST
jgi:enterochelin esterase-like enzyme